MGRNDYVTMETVAYSVRSHCEATFRLTYEVTPRGDAQRWFLVAMEELDVAPSPLKSALES